jgi:hydroxypyruvate isomerase
MPRCGAPIASVKEVYRMPRFAANLSFLFQDLPLYERIGAARENGFAGVEYAAPYDYDVAELKRRLNADRLTQVNFNLPMGDFAKGERGFASDPARTEQFRRGTDEAVAIARELECARVNCLVGVAIPGLDPAVARQTLVANLRYAAAALGEIGATLLVEPLNRIETPGFLIGTTAEALALIGEVRAPNVKLQFDVYHAQRAEGNIIATIRNHVDRIGHVQIADSPGRNEPGTGELAWERIIPALDDAGYDGWIAAEYKPSRPVPETFAWLDAFRAPEAAAR